MSLGTSYVCTLCNVCVCVCVCVCERVCKQRNAYTRALQVDYSVMVVTAGITKAYLGISTHNAIMCAYTEVMP